MWAVWAVSGPSDDARQRETTLTDGQSFPLVSAASEGSGQAAAFVSQKILSICAM